MKKRILAVLMCLMLAMCAPGIAQMASQGYDTEGLLRYSSFSLDGESGEWSVSDPLFEAILDAIQAGEVKNNMKDGLAVYQMRLSGNAQTGTLRPEMELLYVASSPIGVRAVSILADGVRYDMRASGRATSVGAYPVEQVVLPMEDLQAAQAIAGAKNVSIMLHGTRGVYATKIAQGSDKNAKERLEAASLRCCSLLGELEGLNISSYALWDLSEAEWKLELGFAPQCSAVETNSFGMIVYGDKGSNVESLQELLAGAGFYAGAKETTFGEKTAAAVARAQAYFGLLETGSADDVLVNCLKNGSAPEAEEAKDAALAMEALEDVQIGLRRWWQAGRVNASASKNALSGLVCSDSGNVFVVCEGAIINGSHELGLGWLMTGELIVNGDTAYSCTLRVESDGGENFAPSLLPMAKSRFVALAEVPAGALDGAQSAVLVLTKGAETAEFSLIG